MFLILLLVTVLFPIFDLIFLFYIGGEMGVGLTFFLLLTSFALGVVLLRYAKLRTLSTVQQCLAQGELPAQELLDGALLWLAGVLFLLPGFATDIIALLLVFPVSRFFLRWGLIALVRRKSGSLPVTRSSVIEGEFKKEADEPCPGQKADRLQPPETHP